MTDDRIDDLKLAAATAGVQGEVVLPEDHTVILNGMRLHYLDWGTSNPDTIVFLHGGGLNAHTWDLVCIALRDRFRCVALDQRGHGDSEWSPVMDYGAEAHAGDIQAFIDHLGLARFSLVGMSMGGMNSIVYAGRHSDRLSALVLVDVGPDVRPEGARRIHEFTTQAADLDSVDDFVERAMKFNPRRDPRLLRRSLLHNLRQTPEGKWTWKYDRRHRIGADIDETTARFQRYWDDVTRITCPTLVVRGGVSDVFSDEDAARLAKALPDGRSVTVPDASHTVQGDQPRELARVLREFLSDHANGNQALARS